jgi:hypothetical protein
MDNSNAPSPGGAPPSNSLEVVAPVLMTTEDLAVKVGQNPRLIRRLCDERRITYRLVGKRRMLTMEDWTEYLASTVKPALPAQDRHGRASIRRTSGGRPLKGRPARREVKL